MFYWVHQQSDQAMKLKIMGILFSFEKKKKKRFNLLHPFIYRIFSRLENHQLMRTNGMKMKETNL